MKCKHEEVEMIKATLKLTPIVRYGQVLEFQNIQIYCRKCGKWVF